MKNTVNQPDRMDPDTKRLTDLLGAAMQTETQKTKDEFKILLEATNTSKSARGGHWPRAATRMPDRQEGELPTRAPLAIAPDFNCVTLQIPSTNYIWGVPPAPQLIHNVPPFDTGEVVGYSAADRQNGTIELVSQAVPDDTTAESCAGFRFRQMSAGFFIANAAAPQLPGVNAAEVSIPLHVSGTSLIWPGFTQQHGLGLSQLTAKLQVIFPSGRPGLVFQYPLTEHVIPSYSVPNLERTDFDTELPNAFLINPGERLAVGIIVTVLVAVTEDSNLTALANYSSLRSAASRPGRIRLPLTCIRFCRVVD